MRVAKAIELDAQTHQVLRVLSRRKRVEARLQQRARIVLLAARGMQNKDIAVEVGLDRRQVALWRARFLAGGVEALRQDAPRTGRPPRAITPREAAILQSFPEDYVFHPTDQLEPVARMIGNAVPPRLASFYAGYLCRSLKEKNHARAARQQHARPAVVAPDADWPFPARTAKSRPTASRRT